jgi:hypothetical protein
MILDFVTVVTIYPSFLFVCWKHVGGREINSSKQKLLLPNYIATKRREAFEMK